MRAHWFPSLVLVLAASACAIGCELMVQLDRSAAETPDDAGCAICSDVGSDDAADAGDTESTDSAPTKTDASGPPDTGTGSSDARPDGTAVDTGGKEAG